MSNHCKVSIVVPTYNHGPYIRQCLDSLVAQKTTFPYEILVGEDESTDGTREICVEYAEKYPEKIRLFLNKREDVVYINGYPTGRRNLINLLQHAKGEYIAFCDGDDYWVDPLKLEKQTVFLDNHPSVGLVHTGASFLYEKNKHLVRSIHQQMGLPEAQGKVYELLLRRSFIVTVTMMARKHWVNAFLDWKEFDHYHYMMFDYPLKLYIAVHAEVGYIPEITAVHRILLESASNSRSIEKMLRFYQSQYAVVQFFCKKFGCSEETKHLIEQRYARLFMKRYAVLGDRKNARVNFNKLRKLARMGIRLQLTDYLYGLFILPGLNSLFRRIYRRILAKRAATF